MSILICGLVLFFSVHSVSIANDPWRNRMATRLGEWPWKGLYSLLALLGILLIIWGYGLARQVPLVLYAPPVWLRHLTFLVMLPVFTLLLAAYLPGRIQARTGHPMLLGTMLWAFGHLLVNGTLADLLLFGSFLVWAAVDRISLQHRIQRPWPGAGPSRRNDAIAIAAGLIIYVAVFAWLHPWLIGVSPIGSLG